MPIVKYPSEGEPTKEVTAPVIVTKNGAQIVHEDAVTQIPKSVADHVITGDVDPDATDNGALQAPALPVEVTSGKVGPDATYDPKNWGGDTIWISHYATQAAIWNGSYGNGEQAGDLLVASCLYDNTDHNAAPTFNSEANLDRLFTSYITNPTGSNFGAFFGMWKLTAAFGSTGDLQVTLGPSSNHEQTTAVVRNLSEFY